MAWKSSKGQRGAHSKSAPHKREQLLEANQTQPRKKRKLDPSSPPQEKVKKKLLTKKGRKKQQLRVRGQHAHPTPQESFTLRNIVKLEKSANFLELSAEVMEIHGGRKCVSKLREKLWRSKNIQGRHATAKVERLPNVGLRFEGVFISTENLLTNLLGVCLAPCCRWKT